MFYTIYKAIHPATYRSGGFLAHGVLKIIMNCFPSLFSLLQKTYHGQLEHTASISYFRECFFHHLVRRVYIGVYRNTGIGNKQPAMDALTAVLFIKASGNPARHWRPSVSEYAAVVAAVLLRAVDHVLRDDNLDAADLIDNKRKAD